MNLILNGQPIVVDECNIVELLATRGIDGAVNGVAVAVNDALVPRAEWGRHLLRDGDRVEVITAMQGG